MNRDVSFQSVRQLLAAAVEDADGDALTAALMVKERLSEDPEFRFEVGDALTDYAVMRLAEEIEAEMTPVARVLPDGTPW